MIAPVTQYSVMFVSSASRSSQPSKSPRWSLQVWNFSTIHAARPAGESVSAYAIVWLIAVFYIWTIWRRVNKLEVEFRTLEHHSAGRRKMGSDIRQGQTGV